jgi:tRNA threonylcarbamoyl adenosine modification protein (Sua5/YciO/YrdC/YwlC family)
MKYLLSKLSSEKLVTLAEQLKKGSIAIIPTDTQYGIVTTTTNQLAVEKIYQLRKRSSDKPLIILIENIEEIKKMGIKLNPQEESILKKLWPNPVSIIIPADNPELEYLHRGKKSLAFRLPNTPWLQNLLKISGPLVAPSANLEGEIWEQEYKIGVPQKKVKSIGTCKDTGTITTFRPDESIFETVDFEWKTIVDHFRQHCYLTKGIHMVITDARTPEEKAKDKTALDFPYPTYQFYFEGGVSSFVGYLNQNKEAKNETIFYVEKEAEGVNVEVALQYNNDFSESLFAFTNNIFNGDGGTHVAGFRTALTRSLNTYARNIGYFSFNLDKTRLCLRHSVQFSAVV